MPYVWCFPPRMLLCMCFFFIYSCVEMDHTCSKYRRRRLRRSFRNKASVDKRLIRRRTTVWGTACGCSGIAEFVLGRKLPAVQISFLVECKCHLSEAFFCCVPHCHKKSFRFSTLRPQAFFHPPRRATVDLVYSLIESCGRAASSSMQR
ncbi:unnamed protein product [Hapterophycus canaliculatus]